MTKSAALMDILLASVAALAQQHVAIYDNQCSPDPTSTFYLENIGSCPKREELGFRLLRGIRRH